MTIENAGWELQHAMRSERWFIAVGVLDNRTLILYVTNRVKSEQRINKRPLHWFGFRLEIKQVSRTKPAALRGGIGNHTFTKRMP